jgi:hypothetical protein
MPDATHWTRLQCSPSRSVQRSFRTRLLRAFAMPSPVTGARSWTQATAGRSCSPKPETHRVLPGWEPSPPARGQACPSPRGVQDPLVLGTSPGRHLTYRVSWSWRVGTVRRSGAENATSSNRCAESPTPGGASWFAQLPEQPCQAPASRGTNALRPREQHVQGLPAARRFSPPTNDGTRAEQGNGDRQEPRARAGAPSPTAQVLTTAVTRPARPPSRPVRLSSPEP